MKRKSSTKSLNRKVMLAMMPVAAAVITILAVYFSPSGLFRECTCTQLGTTSMPVLDEDSLWLAVAFYVSQDFAVIGSEEVAVCDRESLYRAEFMTSNKKTHYLYLDESGDVYKCA